MYRKTVPETPSGGGTKGLEKRLAAVEQGRASETAYGLVQLCNSTAVTDSVGKALPTSENNAALPGTMANRIAAVQDGVRRVYSKTWLQNSVESEDGDGFRWIVGKSGRDHRFYSRITTMKRIAWSQAPWRHSPVKII